MNILEKINILLEETATTCANVDKFDTPKDKKNKKKKMYRRALFPELDNKIQEADLPKSISGNLMDFIENIEQEVGKEFTDIIYKPNKKLLKFKSDADQNKVKKAFTNRDVKIKNFTVEGKNFTIDLYNELPIK